MSVFQMIPARTLLRDMRWETFQTDDVSILERKPYADVKVAEQGREGGRRDQTLSPLFIPEAFFDIVLDLCPESRVEYPAARP